MAKIKTKTEVLLLVAEIKPMTEVELDKDSRWGVGESCQLALPTPRFDVAVAQRFLALVAELPPHPLHLSIFVINIPMSFSLFTTASFSLSIVLSYWGLLCPKCKSARPLYPCHF